MASSRKPKPSSARRNAAASLVSRVAASLRATVKPGDALVVGLSGGLDSVVLLDLLQRLARRMRFTLEALHVDHQLSPNASSWARFCRAMCKARGIRCRVVKVEVRRGNSTERAAREARYGALLATRADHVALAHHRDDQAETVLLQLLRGAGVKGLAAMASVRRADCGVRPSILRPLLDAGREEIARYGKRRRLEWIEDESNLDPRYTRNWVRREILPRIEARVPSYREVLARAARNFGEAAALLDDLARIDAEQALRDDDTREDLRAGVRIEALRALGAARSKNLLRYLIRRRGWRMPEADRLEEALRQALTAKSDAVLAVTLGECELRRHGGRLHLVSRVALPAAGDIVVAAWRGEREIALPRYGGVLTMARARGEGVSVARLGDAPVTIRERRGGERLQPDAGRPRRTVKNLLQEARMPTWERERLPFIYCGDALACVPGVAIDWRFRADRGEPSIVPAWHLG